jgi:hypothetical protein
MRKIYSEKPYHKLVDWWMRFQFLFILALFLFLLCVLF